jgi:hypothetical protein
MLCVMDVIIDGGSGSIVIQELRSCELVLTCIDSRGRLLFSFQMSSRESLERVTGEDLRHRERMFTSGALSPFIPRDEVTIAGGNWGLCSGCTLLVGTVIYLGFGPGLAVCEPAARDALLEDGVFVGSKMVCRCGWQSVCCVRKGL